MAALRAMTAATVRIAPIGAIVTTTETTAATTTAVTGPTHAMGTSVVRLELRCTLNASYRPRPCENANRMSRVRHLDAISGLRQTIAHSGPFVAAIDR